MSLIQPGTWYADPAHFKKPSRRSFMHIGFLGCLGLTLDQYLRMQSSAKADGYYQPASKEGKTKSVIQIFMPGGMAHQESFDPKPNAPIEYRGEMGSIPTKLPGVFINSALSRTAQIADKLTIIRSMTHGEAAHERGTHNMFTGYRPSPALEYPSFGAVVSHEFGVRNNLPPYVCIPSLPTNYAGTGYLSAAYAPFSLGSDPANGNFTVQDLNLPGGVDEKRFATRRSVLEAVNAHFAAKEKADNISAMDTFYQRAYGLLSSQKAKEAFNINAEPAKLRDEYGRNTAGQRMLLARRLVEAGVRFVSMTYGGWDLHNNIRGGTESQMPAFDQAFARLITDLDQRGLLDSTMVMVTTEFGRTPKINGNAGRDHWPKVFSIVMAGGGVKRGSVFGSSDSTASEPQDDPLSIDDWSTTIYTLLGVEPKKQLLAPGDRPIRVVDGGEVKKELLA
jgi:hypothetical protein